MIFLTKVFNAVLRRQYFPSAWKHARMVSIWSRERTPRCLLPVDPQVYVTLLASSLRRSYSLGSSEIKRARSAAWRAVRVPTQTHHDAAAGLPCWKSQQIFTRRRWPARFPWLWQKPSTRVGQRSTVQAYYPKLPISPGENHILVSSL
jgi:hypothetical protein